MNKDNPNVNDDLREEYDITSLKVRKFRRNRKSFAGNIVRLDQDVAEMFPNAEAVNEALRFLMRVTQQNQSPKI
ncbi:hypothetical protein WH8501_18645 [Crocosphaera watsonii WH 8501]|uniref:Uncharacterized protein n=5 Tax=Crocosphaera watsonii TaxID=263511 RepID=T2JYS3_CROWT|nr:MULTISPECIES: hypothetical protein [Crocosphaera]EHJ09578.1 hypothetical protein CWATWH0003_5647 [Crocosphaera watsonii WH 0003]MCH2245651.1 hypothetical protein [Crocosphaera sp.]NQZ64067.1 hypothetical protein [Crocosphaera sp.]CCQ53088.1 FIG00566355: hypothetical protein [Crocosphaera watsonii WH 8502]CCQ55759.1 hypothetical protein CWATWH0005_4043 [Crocosphaera watsonii WH 0005]